MNRTVILVAALTGAAGLAIGWFANGTRTGPATTLAYDGPGPAEAKAEAVAPAPTTGPKRVEFALGTADIANDRETPALAVDSQGRVALAWAAQSGEAERSIYLTRSSDGGLTFDPPTLYRKVSIYRYASRGKGPAVTYSTHALPRLVAAGDGLDLGWVEAVKGGPEVTFYVARSGDGGKTFSEPTRVHGKDASRPGFTTISAAPDGTLLAAWIDARNHAQQPFFAARPEGSEGFGPERMVYAGPEGKGICPCCDLAALRLPDGSDLVAFRNSDSGHRDIWTARAPGSGVRASIASLVRRWAFEGCPHDGPSLALTGGRVHAVWMSGHSGRNRVYSASASPESLAFEPRELSPETTGAQGHPKVVATASGALVAVWDESLDVAPPAAKGSHGHGPSLEGSGRAVYLARAENGAAGFGPAVAVAPRPGSFQLNPAVAVGADGAAVVAWSEVDGQGKRVVVVRLGPEKGAR